MQHKQAFKYFGALGASYFTAITALICLFFFIFGSTASEETVMLLQPERILLVLILSFVMSAGSTVYRYAPVSKTAAICLHAAIYNLGFFAFLWITVASYEENVGKRFVIVAVGTLILAAIYCAVTVSLRMIRRATVSQSKHPHKQAVAKAEKNKSTEKKVPKQKKSKKEPYETQFS